jgi:hypothetical protein
VGSYIKSKYPDIVAHICNPSYSGGKDQDRSQYRQKVTETLISIDIRGRVAHGYDHTYWEGG